MRDPKRIEPVLRALGDLWRANPDLRLFQLFYWLTQNKDLFHVEDAEALAIIKGKKPQ